MMLDQLRSRIEGALSVDNVPTPSKRIVDEVMEEALAELRRRAEADPIVKE